MSHSLRVGPGADFCYLVLMQSLYQYQRIPSPLPVLTFGFYVCLCFEESLRVLETSWVWHKEVELDPTRCPSLACDSPGSLSHFPLLFGQYKHEIALVN